MHGIEFPTITQLLRADHQRFRKLLREIWTGLQEPEQTMARWSLRKLLRDMRTHEAVEEGILYPTISQKMKEVDAAAFDMFQSDHNIIDKKLNELQETLESYASPLSQITAAMDFESSFKEHMEQEERVLFPLIDRQLPLNISRELAKRASHLLRNDRPETGQKTVISLHSREHALR